MTDIHSISSSLHPEHSSGIACGGGGGADGDLLSLTHGGDQKKYLTATATPSSSPIQSSLLTRERSLCGCIIGTCTDLECLFVKLSHLPAIYFSEGVYPRDSIRSLNKQCQRGLRDSLPRVTISVEGNIAAGKSTFLQLVQEDIKHLIEIQQEPVERWKDRNGFNLLQAYYDNPHKYACEFQKFAAQTRLEQQDQPLDSRKLIRIRERCSQSDRLFAELCMERGYFSPEEVETYRSWYDERCSPDRQKLPITGRIYLRCSPRVCFERAKVRSRSEESEIPMEYFEKVHHKHEMWLNGNTTNVDDVPVLTLDWDEPLLSFYGNRQVDVVDRVISFIQKLMGVGPIDHDTEDIALGSAVDDALWECS